MILEDSRQYGVSAVAHFARHRGPGDVSDACRQHHMARTRFYLLPPRDFYLGCPKRADATPSCTGCVEVFSLTVEQFL